MPPSLTTWTRLEPHARSATLDGGLRAALHDPLWLLARQWQMGEFQAEDVGSPVHVRVQIDGTRLTRYQPGGLPSGWYVDGGVRSDASVQGQLLDGTVPLETLVERERIRLETAPQPRLAAEAGLHLWRLLSASGAGAHRAAVLAQFPLPALAEDPQRPLDGDTRRFAAVTARRVPDGARLAPVLKAVRDATPLTGLPAQVAADVRTWQSWSQTLAAADRAKVATAVNRWLEWYEALFSEPPAPGNPAWIPERMEYAALLAAPTPRGEVVLAAPEYVEGHLDWYSFDVLPAGSLSAARNDLTLAEPHDERVTRSAIPVPVSFRGMPAPRWWEFEDARVDFGAVTATAQQLVRLLLVEFALVYGNDWFLVPVVVPVGTVCRTNWLVVTDTFGERTLVPSARAVDARILGLSPEADLPWDLFRLARDRRPVVGVARPSPDALLLPPALGTSLHSPPLEDVLLLRDEMANMAWAVERVVESPLGRPLNRSELYFRTRPEPDRSDPGSRLYRLISDVPDHWVPLLPVRRPDDAPALRLHRGRPWQGRILEPRLDQGAPLPIYGEEVPREGARVTRAFQYARWMKGRTFLWIGRRKGIGRGEGSSGLRFDTLGPGQ